SHDRAQLRRQAQRIRQTDRAGQAGTQEEGLILPRPVFHNSVWLAALAVLLLPFLLVDVPPVLDYPNHLARIFVLAHPDDPILARFYAPNWHITPNLGFDPIAMLLLRVLPVH